MKTVLNPTTVTRDIINRLQSKRNIFIAGEKGSGKSFSYLIYNYLSSFILKYRLNSKSKSLSHEIFWNTFTGDGLQEDAFRSVVKIFYFILPN